MAAIVQPRLRAGMGFDDEVILRQRVCRGSGCQAVFWICQHCDRGQCYCPRIVRGGPARLSWKDRKAAVSWFHNAAANWCVDLGNALKDRLQMAEGSRKIRRPAPLCSDGDRRSLLICEEEALRHVYICLRTEARKRRPMLPCYFSNTRGVLGKKAWAHPEDEGSGGQAISKSHLRFLLFGFTWYCKRNVRGKGELGCPPKGREEVPQNWWMKEGLLSEQAFYRFALPGPSRR